MVNARTRHNHPCEILGDLAYVLAEGRAIEDLNVVFVGEATNLGHSWAEAAAALPIKLTQVSPAVSYDISVDWWRSLTLAPSGSLHIERGLEPLAGADIIYTDTWPDPVDATDVGAVKDLFLPLQITCAALETAPPSALFLPCPPVTRGEEVSAEAMNSSRCKVPAAKDWLLYAQNALLEDLLRHREQ